MWWSISHWALKLVRMARGRPGSGTCAGSTALAPLSEDEEISDGDDSDGGDLGGVTMVMTEKQLAGLSAAQRAGATVGWCRLTLSIPRRKRLELSA